MLSPENEALVDRLWPDYVPGQIRDAGDLLNRLLDAARAEGGDTHTYDNRFANLVLALVLKGAGGEVVVDPREFNPAWKVKKTYSQDGQTITYRLEDGTPKPIDNGPALQAFMADVAKEFGGKLPGDAWHLYLMKGMSPAEAAAQHRRIA